MAMADNVLYLEEARSRGGEARPAPDAAEAAELVAALSALIDAGLVVVHDAVGGPARYGVGGGLGGVA